MAAKSLARVLVGAIAAHCNDQEAGYVLRAPRQSAREMRRPYEGLALSGIRSDFASKACSRTLMDQTTSHVMQ